MERSWSERLEPLEDALQYQRVLEQRLVCNLLLAFLKVSPSRQTLEI